MKKFLSVLAVVAVAAMSCFVFNSCTEEGDVLVSVKMSGDTGFEYNFFVTGLADAFVEAGGSRLYSESNDVIFTGSKKSCEKLASKTFQAYCAKWEESGKYNWKGNVATLTSSFNGDHTISTYTFSK